MKTQKLKTMKTYGKMFQMSVKIIALFLICSLLILSCEDDDRSTLSESKAITSFAIVEKEATINEEDKTIALITGQEDLTSLSPTIVVSEGATVSPASGEEQDFTNPVTYTVTAEDESTQEYTVTVEKTKATDKAITSFVIAEKEATINEEDKTVALTTDEEDLTSLSPTIVISEGATVSPASGEEQDFTAPVTYTVTAEDESTQEYTVTVEKTKATDKTITSFVIAEKEATINEEDKTIALTTDQEDLTSLSPTIVVSEGATVSPASGEEQDFTAPVTYTVTAEDESTQEYTVTVTKEKTEGSEKAAITSFRIINNRNIGRSGIINETDKTITISNYGSDLTNLTASFRVDEGTSFRYITEEAQDFTNPVIYTVTSEDGTSVAYTVTVTPTNGSNFTQYKDKEWVYGLLTLSDPDKLRTKSWKIDLYTENGVDKTAVYKDYIFKTRAYYLDRNIQISYLMEEDGPSLFYLTGRLVKCDLESSDGAPESRMESEDYMWIKIWSLESNAAAFFWDDTAKLLRDYYNVDKTSTSDKIIMRSRDDNRMLILKNI